jgi:predicted O-methyltransferase YrrM
MIWRRIRRIYKRFGKPIVKPIVKGVRKRQQVVAPLLASFVRQPANLPYAATWIESLRFRGSPVAAHVPNWPYTATRYLEMRLSRRAVAFEYGGGGSTLWLAKRVARLTTIEHDAGWFGRIEEALTQTGLTNCVVLMREPGRVTPSLGMPGTDGIDYSSTKCMGSFADYVQAIDTFPDDSFDLVLVDGRSRAACLHHAAPKVRRGGMLILDDSNRESYQTAMKRLDSWVRKDFCGVKPFRTELGYTTCWIKRDSLPYNGDHELQPRTEPTNGS